MLKDWKQISLRRNQVRMCLKISVLLLGLSISIAFGRKLQYTLKTDDKIRQLHSESMVLAEGHQDVSSICFSFYNPRLDQVTTDYQTAYDSCLDNYEESSKKVENCFVNDRAIMEASAFQSCSALTSCNRQQVAYDAFACASTTAAVDAKIFYEISANATNLAERSKLDYNRVDTQKEVCVNEAERNYVEDTTKVYIQLNGCLMGNGVPYETSTPPNDVDDTTAPRTPIAPDYTFTTPGSE